MQQKNLAALHHMKHFQAVSTIKYKQMFFVYFGFIFGVRNKVSGLTATSLKANSKQNSNHSDFKSVKKRMLFLLACLFSVSAGKFL